jgi:Fe-S oxidoreductase
MWMEEHLGKRINAERTDEAAATGAEVLGVGCPYCLVMLDDGARGRGGDLEVKDVAQVVAESVGVERPAAAGRPASPEQAS